MHEILQSVVRLDRQELATECTSQCSEAASDGKRYREDQRDINAHTSGYPWIVDRRPQLGPKRISFQAEPQAESHCGTRPDEEGAVHGQAPWTEVTVALKG